MSVVKSSDFFGSDKEFDAILENVREDLVGVVRVLLEAHESDDVLVFDVADARQQVVEEGAEVFVRHTFSAEGGQHFEEFIKVGLNDVKLVSVLEATHLSSTDVSAVLAIRVGYFGPGFGFALGVGKGGETGSTAAVSEVGLVVGQHHFHHLHLRVVLEVL